jgi:polysaccharide biosynthesis transport protein
MENSEDKSPVSLHGCWLRLCRHRLLVAASVFVGWAIITGIAWIVPAKYRSETLILIEQQRVPEHYVEPNVALDMQQRLQSMSEQILSRTRLMGIIDKFHLYNGSNHADPDRLLATMRMDIGLELIKGERPDQISAFKISYSANNPVIAQQVTSELTSLFIEENLRNREQLSQDTTTFLESQLDQARKSLDQQEERLRQFKNRYMGELPEQTTTNLQILTGLQTRLQSASDALNSAQQQRLYLQSLITEYQGLRPSAKEGGGNLINGVDDLDQKLERLKSQLSELNAKYTPKHPDIIRLQQEIAATERSKEASEAKTSKSDPSNVTASPTTRDAQSAATMAQVQSQLKASDFEIANRKTEIKKIEADIDAYQSRLNLTPAREQELAAITRDHEQSRTNYESLLAKKNQSAMATDLEKRQQGEQFRMIDPPSMPQKPYFPNRLQFSLGGLTFGLAFGLALIALIEFAKPRVYGEEELKAIVKAPLLLVTIPPLPTPKETFRAARYRVLEVAMFAAMLVIIPAITFLIYRKG